MSINRRIVHIERRTHREKTAIFPTVLSIPGPSTANSLIILTLVNVRRRQQICSNRSFVIF